MSRMVVDNVKALGSHEGIERVRRDVKPFKPRPFRDVPNVPRDKVVDNDDVVPCFKVRSSYVRSDESCAAGDEYLHDTPFAAMSLRMYLVE
jgi:hypothetical protein